MQRRDRRRSGWRLAVAGMVLLGLAAPALAAPPPAAVEAMRVGLGNDSNLFKVGTWTLVRVQIKGGPAGFTGFLDLIVPDDSDTPTVFRRPITVGANSTEWFATYARPGSINADFQVQLRDPRGYRVGPPAASGNLPGTQDVKSLWSDQSLIGTLGRPEGVQAISKLPNFSSSGNNQRMGPGVEAVGIQVPDGIPARPYGYDGLEAVVFDTSDSNALAAIDAFRGEALKSWVRNGGHLVLAVGSNWQQVRDSVLSDMLPATLAGPTQIDDLGSLESFAGSSKPISKPGGPRVTVTKLEGVEAKNAKPLDSSTTPLIVRGPYGFGRVTLLALDVNQKPFTDWEDRAMFWVKAIDIQRPNEQNTGGGPGNAMLYQANVSDLSTLLRRALEQFPGITLVPFGWVAFFIFLYILLIGPGDYFFLKKVLKRMELTWITFPVIVLTVSLVAYFAAYAVKGTDLRVNKVDAVDLDQETNLVRGSTWVTVFSPQNRDYDVSVLPQALGQGTSGGTSAPSSARPRQDTELVVSWFGIPETAFGGMSNSGGLSLSGSSYEYAPISTEAAPDRPERLEHVRVPIWSTKSFTGRWAGPGQKIIDAELEPVGTDRLAGTVTNLLKEPLQNAILAFGKQVYMLGSIAPGATVQVEMQTDRNLASYLGELTNGVPVEPWNVQNANLPRSALVRSLMFRDTAGGRTTMLASNPLHYLDLTGQLALDRPMLVADLEKDAGSTLVLGGSSRTPITAQTTVVRVILPLKRPKNE